jgi:hypothetical protein
MADIRSLFVALLLTAAGCFGQCNSHPLRPSLLPPCPSIADRLGTAVAAAGEFNSKVAELNALIDAARRRFWKAFPNGPDFNAAEATFLDALWQKDIYYMLFSLPEGVTGRASRMPNTMGILPGGNVAPEDLPKFPKNVDEGIRPYAFPLFVEWVNALRRADGRDKDGLMASPLLLASAIKDKSNWRKAYENARNWAEFMSSGQDISKYVTPQVYLLRQMESDVSMTFARAKPPDLPDGAAAALDLYNFFVKLFGEKEVLAAAGAVLRIPKNSVGGLAKRADVEIGTYIASPSPNPFLLFLTQVTNSNPHNYAIALFLDQYALLSGQATATFHTKEYWTKALADYNQLAGRYGEPVVLSAAARLKAAPKDPQRGIRGDPQARPLLHWFRAMILDPKTVIPDGGVARYESSEFDPQWIGKVAVVHGTVSRVSAGSAGTATTIYFKDSPKMNASGCCSSMLNDLRFKYGADFSGLVGKEVEIEGDINPRSGTDPSAGAYVRITDANSQIRVLGHP